MLRRETAKRRRKSCRVTASRTSSLSGHPALGPTRVLVADDTMLDARLALYHRVERWLAVADVHFGYELSQRAAGALFPMWGMDSIEAGCWRCWQDYRPARLIIAGDFVHRPRCPRTEAAARHLRRSGCGSAFGERPASWCWWRATTTGGRFAAGALCEWHATERFCFHHGDGAGTGRRG